jgi:glycogen phosphorylase
VLTLPPVDQQGSIVIFAKEFVPYQTGRLGYSMRVSPNHYEDPLTRACNSLLKWGSDN